MLLCLNRSCIISSTIGCQTKSLSNILVWIWCSGYQSSHSGCHWSNIDSSSMTLFDDTPNATRRTTIKEKNKILHILNFSWNCTKFYRRMSCFLPIGGVWLVFRFFRFVGTISDPIFFFIFSFHGGIPMIFNGIISSSCNLYEYFKIVKKVGLAVALKIGFLVVPEFPKISRIFFRGGLFFRGERGSELDSEAEEGG